MWSLALVFDGRVDIQLLRLQDLIASLTSLVVRVARLMDAVRNA